jgi:hypothetical protein
MADPDDSKREPSIGSERKKASAAKPELFTITFDAGTGEVVKFERIDANGVRQDLSESDRTRLAANRNEGRLGGIQNRRSRRISRACLAVELIWKMSKSRKKKPNCGVCCYGS